MTLLIIGGGAIAENTHIPSAIELIGSENVIVAEPNSEQASKLRGKFSLSRIVSDYRDVLESVDACVICTPPHLHNGILRDCISHGKSVLCEKPLSPSSSETREILSLAPDNIVIGMCHTYRFYPSRKKVRGLILEGFFGSNPVVKIEEGIVSNWPTVSGYCFKKDLVPGGALFDNGIHSLDFLLWCFGEPDSVSYSDDSMGGLESNLSIAFQFGRVASYYKLSRSRSLSNTITITGNGHCAELGIFNTSSYVLDGRMVKCEENVPSIAKAQLDNFLGAVAGKEQLVAPVSSGVNVIALLERCYEQRKTTEYEKNALGGFEGKTVLVTGGTGFIGSHLVEQLVLHEGANVKVLVHRWGKAACVSRFDVELVKGDVSNPEDVEAAMRGCDYVFHLAILGGSTKEEVVLNNIRAVESVLSAAKSNGVAHVVQMSSVVVHGETVSPGLSADSPLVSYNDSYADSKLESERRFWELIDEYGLHGSIVRPTYVWGPYSMWYTIDIVNQMKEGRFAWVNNGDCVCNAVYVGNVVDMCLRCCTNPMADHQSFIVTDDQDITWREFFSYYLDAIDVSPDRYQSIPLVDGFDRKWRKSVKAILSKNMDILMDRYEKLVPSHPIIALWLYKAPRKVLRLIRKRVVKRLPEMPPATFAIYSQQCQIDVRKNRELLGFIPRFSVAEGMKRTCDWLKWPLDEN